MSHPRVHSLHWESRGDYPDSVYIGRPGKGEDGYFGNPIPRGVPCQVCGVTHTDAGLTLVCYKRYLGDRIKTDPEFRSRVRALAGRHLFCFCAPRLCHGDTLARLADALVRS